MTYVGDFDDVIVENAVNDAIGISSGQERSITLEGIEHRWTHFWKIAEELQLINDLILNARGECLQFFLARGSSLMLLATLRSSCFKFLQGDAFSDPGVAFGFGEPFPPIRLTHFFQRGDHSLIRFIIDQQRGWFPALGN